MADDLTVNSQLLRGLGADLSGIATTVRTRDCDKPFTAGFDEMPGTATASVSKAAGPQVAAAFSAVAQRIQAMAEAATINADNFEDADKAFAALLNQLGGGAY